MGGRVTAGEIDVFGTELIELLEAFSSQPFSMLIDYSKANPLTGDAVTALARVKDECFEFGAVEIVSVVNDEQDLVTHQTMRLQEVLEGKERFVADPAQAKLKKHEPAAIRLAA